MGEEGSWRFVVVVEGDCWVFDRCCCWVDLVVVVVFVSEGANLGGGGETFFGVMGGRSTLGQELFQHAEFLVFLLFVVVC